jgi:Leucine-rich repeat (LRR) protein
LDKNKIRVILETSFFFQTNLVELHLEENRIRELSYFDRMVKLEKLFLGSNKIQVKNFYYLNIRKKKSILLNFKEVCEIEKLIPLICLAELSLINNPVKNKF